MPLPDAQAVFADLLVRGAYQAEYRVDLVSKNWLAVGKVSAQDVVEMLVACKENQYRSYPHLDDPRTTVHDFRPRWRGGRWIVKGYVLAVGAMFISVHPAT